MYISLYKKYIKEKYSQCLDVAQTVEGAIKKSRDVVIVQGPVRGNQEEEEKNVKKNHETAHHQCEGRERAGASR